MYAFLALFGILIAYIIYFQVGRSQTVLSSPYNTLQDLYAEHVVRGDIISSDGEVLATTKTAEDGTETRVYPYENEFAHAVGYFGHGKSGLESAGNYYLLQSHSFFLNRLLQNLTDEKMQGDALVATLNAGVQQAAYDAIGSRKGAAVVLEAETGKILAMVSKPDYDPNTIGANWDDIVEDEESTVLLNRVTSGLYPPGSVFKILTLLEYIHEDRDYDNFRFNCEGTFTAYGDTLHCYKDYVHGTETLADAFANSCNGAFGKIGLDLDLGEFNKLTEKLLFNQKLPTGLITKNSTFSLEKDSSTGLIMQTAIGQGSTLVTPLHMAMLAAAIDCGGAVYEPYLIDHIQNDGGISVKEFEPEKYGSILSKTDASLLKEYMRGVVTDGTASQLDKSLYTAYGKTGSAEYNSSGDSHGWFVGFAEADGAKDVAIAVIIEDGGSGSTSAVPAAEKILDAYFAYN